MTGVRLELANPHTYPSPKEYVQQHLAPLVTELQRLTTELLAPGSTSAEEAMVDMVPEVTGAIWQRLDRRLHESAKHVVFDGSEYFTLPKEIQRAKQVKVQLLATVYVESRQLDGYVHFRLADEDGAIISGSEFTTDCRAPVDVLRVLSFGDGEGLIGPTRKTYFLEARSDTRHATPVCRRFSLSFVYI